MYSLFLIQPAAFAIALAGCVVEGAAWPAKEHPASQEVTRA